MKVKRGWHASPPPSIGWWAASAYEDGSIWRWWNGKQWSRGFTAFGPPPPFDNLPLSTNENIKYIKFWPLNARVAR